MLFLAKANYWKTFFNKEIAIYNPAISISSKIKHNNLIHFS